MLRTTTFVLAAIGVAYAFPANAKPIGPSIFCERYPNAPSCLAGMPACTMCHEGSPPNRNLYGKTVEAGLLPGAPRPLSDADYAAHLPEALAAAESMDADQDGFTNLDEITAGTLPGDDRSKPDASACPPTAPNPNYSVCNYDAKLVFRKI